MRATRRRRCPPRASRRPAGSAWSAGTRRRRRCWTGRWAGGLAGGGWRVAAGGAWLPGCLAPPGSGWLAAAPRVCDGLPCMQARISTRAGLPAKWMPHPSCTLCPTPPAGRPHADQAGRQAALQAPVMPGRGSSSGGGGGTAPVRAGRAAAAAPLPRGRCSGGSGCTAPARAGRAAAAAPLPRGRCSGGGGGGGGGTVLCALVISA